ncbi:MAG: zinc-ribbon domain containing protein [Anaerohalosphaera sp.]|nr:zinc-ribbon domain containing protein [Anaerohalosphaera sp.]
MKSNKQKRKELKESRIRKQAKREAAKLASLFPHRTEHKVAVNPNALSAESQRSWGIPEYYKDQYNKCVDCGKEIMFSAERQKDWYEVKKRIIYEHPIRCAKHFVEWSLTRKSKSRLDYAMNKLKQNPKSEEALLDCALSIIDYHKNSGKGNLQKALHLLRQLNEEGDAMEYCKEQIQNAVQTKVAMKKVIDSLRSETIYAFQQATGKQNQLEKALLEFLYRGQDAGIVKYELWDILGEGNDCVVAQAEISGEDKCFIIEYLTCVINDYCDSLENSSSLEKALDKYQRKIEKLYERSIEESDEE